MDFTTEIVKCLLYKENCNLSSTLDSLQSVLQHSVHTTDALTADLVSTEFLNEIRSFTHENILLYFGNTLRDLKCVLIDQECMREHEIFFKYKGPNKLVVTSVSFPKCLLDQKHQEYRSLEELVDAFKLYLTGLAGYFHELELIDRCCSVMEPLKPTFEEGYRRILLNDRTWLHVEVTPEGLATNIHLIGQSEHWQDKLQSGLLKWDHDIDIVRNIMTIFDITEFPTPANNKSASGPVFEDKPVEAPVCSICLCDELPDLPGVPLPLCQYPTCGIYFHRACLFQWLVACAGGRPPAFGVANGSCPSCLQPIVCNEKDS